MSKVIIENRTSLSMLECLDRVRQVIEKGRISNNDKQYCYYTTFTDGIGVSTDLNKSSDRFIVLYVGVSQKTGRMEMKK